MQSALFSNSPDTAIREAAHAMREGNFGTLPVSENDCMVGAISDRDIAIRAVAEGKGPETKVRDVMSEGISWAYEDDTVDSAAKIMSERQIRRLPVLDKDSRLVGVVSLGDLSTRVKEKYAGEALEDISRS